MEDIDLEEATITARGDERTNRRILPVQAKQIHLLYEYQYKERARTTSNKLFIGMRGEPRVQTVLPE
jgi:site-specific recombinase XerC